MKFALVIKYGTGKAVMLTDTPDIKKAIENFETEYKRGMPDTKDYGMPTITKAELLPVMYDSIYKDKDNETTSK